MKEPKAWEYRTGYSVPGVAADVVGAELLRIRDTHGALNTNDVVDEARAADSPLHPAFEWDDSIAAERHREQQARRIIHGVRVIYEEGAASEQAFINVRITKDDAQEQHYELSRIVVSSADLWDSARTSALSRIKAAKDLLDELVSIAAREGVKGKQKLAATKARGHVDKAEAALKV